MYKCINGWTKAKMLKVIEARPFEEAAWEGFVCKYLTSNGNKCAVGLFIPDGHSAQRISGDVVYILNKYPDLSDVMPLELQALQKLQKVHDEPKLRESAKTRMINWVEENVEA